MMAAGPASREGDHSTEHGQALILAVAVLAVTALLTAGLTRAAWDATRAARLSQLRAQTVQAATSAAELHHAVLLQTLRNKLTRNIIDQGCRQVDYTGTSCLVPGYDTAGTSGVRRDRIQQLASQSTQGWAQLQNAFVEVFRQVMPLAPEQDRYRTPAATGFAGLAISSQMTSSIPNTRWMAYGIIAPAPGNPITFSSTTRTAAIPFEVRAYGWAVHVPAAGNPGPESRVRAQATTYAAIGTVTLRYPNCTSWPPPPDQICQYPEQVQVDVPTTYLVTGDPSVSWPQGWQ